MGTFVANTDPRYYKIPMSWGCNFGAGGYTLGVSAISVASLLVPADPNQPQELDQIVALPRGQVSGAKLLLLYYDGSGGTALAQGGLIGQGNGQILLKDEVSFTGQTPNNTTPAVPILFTRWTPSNTLRIPASSGAGAGLYITSSLAQTVATLDAHGQGGIY